MANQLGVADEKEIITQIQNGKDNYSIETISKNLFSSCQSHLIKSITHDLSNIQNHGNVEKDNIQFNNHKAYLEHHVNNPLLKPYLENTTIHKALTAISTTEQHVLEQQKVQEQDLQKTKDLEKDFGKGGLGI